MSQISRLHGTEIANGNLIDATHINNELNQLVSESNNQDSRLTSAESTISSHANAFKFFMQGLLVQYSTANRVIIKPGICRDSTNTELMEVTSNITVDIATSGANGLDTGSESTNAWYYVWLIKNTSTGTVAGLLSLSSTNPTMPSGYTKKRLLPIALKNNSSSDFVEFTVGAGWPTCPKIIWPKQTVLSGGTSGTWADVSLSALVPPISRLASIFAESEAYTAATNASGILDLRPKGSSVTYLSIESSRANGTTTGTGWSGHVSTVTDMPTDSSQAIQYQISNSSYYRANIRVVGFTVTEVL